MSKDPNHLGKGILSQQAELARMKREFDLQSSEQVSVFHNLTEVVTKLKVGHTEHTDRIYGVLESVESLGTRMEDTEKDVCSIRHSVAKLTSTQEEMVAELKRMGAQLNDGAPSPQGGSVHLYVYWGPP